LNLFKH